MKIFYISESIIPCKAANSIHVMKMCQAFANNGHETTLFCINGEEKQSNDYEYYGVKQNFTINKIQFKKIKILGLFKFLKKLKYEVKKLKELPDLLYGRNLKGLLILSNLNVPIIYESHHPKASRIDCIFENILFKKSNFFKLVVISEELKKEYLKRYNFLNSEQIIVAHDGADIPSEVDIINNEKKIESDKKLTVGYIGHLYPGKGMEIITEVAKKMPDIKFHVVGGTNEWIEYWKEINIDNIEYHGFVNNGEINLYYNSIDILLLPYKKYVYTYSQKNTKTNSKSTNIAKWISPLKLFEGMAYKKAMIISDLPTIREVITNGENALICDSENIEQWVESINLLMNNREFYTNLSLNAYKTLTEKYTWNIRAKNVIKDLLNE